MYQNHGETKQTAELAIRTLERIVKISATGKCVEHDANLLAELMASLQSGMLCLDHHLGMTFFTRNHDQKGGENEKQ